VPGTPNISVIEVQFPAGFPPPLASGDTVRVLVKGNSFDPTIGVPIKISYTDRSHGVPRILDNIGVNPVGTLDSSLVPVPVAGSLFVNPYPYDCFVNILADGSAVNVTLNGVSVGSIAVGQQRAYLVKAGGSIILGGYTAFTKPTWTWAGYDTA
jgi:hypothetical protein